MASMRSLLRLAPRAHIARPATTTPRTLPIAQQQRTFMFQSHAADDRKKAQEAEEASEDLAGGNEDPNMVWPQEQYRRIWGAPRARTLG